MNLERLECASRAGAHIVVTADSSDPRPALVSRAASCCGAAEARGYFAPAVARLAER
jgi:hypothetical protein